ncbi:hypothetical protein [Sphingomonas beigongshangi]|uniref:hypothetical protein n=1 Tax=Sphingomonas beigongshangi TaxID=2782540 RepID=UPI00193C1518|nr:hypothetical protein [Sphingomonas beigongshangi]
MVKRWMAVAALTTIGAAPAERVVRIDDPFVAVSVNGAAFRVRIDPAAPNMPLIAKTADRGAKSRRMGISYVFGVGSTTIVADTEVARVDYGAGPVKQRIGRTRQPFAAVAPQGSIGPGGLPEPVVRFVLHAPLVGERTVTMAMVRPGFPETLFGSGWAASEAQIMFDGAPLRVRIDPLHPRTLATAGAAVRIARHNDGTLSGEAVSTEIRFGIERPVRTMTLARPLAIGPLAIDRLGVRIADNGKADAIREADSGPVKTDPDEIVVTASGKKRDLRRDVVSLGADVLARCSSIVFDRAAAVIRLTCA